ncbi:hypothetical protein [Paractinoplanes toevensis]|uniref:Uncharacterized protein n=1 Tax=Paractinoplanes toevensis TaxID=571911 RepID=A0A919WAU2_9ACTN|nr:hypothetical protein [Actinoplanes toevensis]GIM96821.1 hypothetical protein Ato02nite_086140 [Actinoplanes toevensis]
MRTRILTVVLVAMAAGCGGDPPPARPSPAPPARTAADLTDAEWAGLIDDLDCAPVNKGVELGDRQVAELRGPGTKDVVVSVDCVHDTSPWPYQVAVYDGSSPADAPVRLGVLLDDDERLLVRKMTITAGRIAIDTIGWAERDSSCCPSVPATRSFTWSGSAFVRA